MTTDESGLVTDARQDEFLANLSGIQSIIGRTIAMYSATAVEAAAEGLVPGDDEEAVAPTACCTIGYDVDILSDA